MMVAGHNAAAGSPAALTRALPPGATRAATPRSPPRPRRRPALHAACHLAGAVAHVSWCATSVPLIQVPIMAGDEQRRGQKRRAGRARVGQRSASARPIRRKLLLSRPHGSVGPALGAMVARCWCPRSLPARRADAVAPFRPCSTYRRRSRSRAAGTVPRVPPRSSSSRRPGQPPNSARRGQREPALPAPEGCAAWLALPRPAAVSRPPRVRGGLAAGPRGSAASLSPLPRRRPDHRRLSAA